MFVRFTITSWLVAIGLQFSERFWNNDGGSILSFAKIHILRFGFYPPKWNVSLLCCCWKSISNIKSTQKLFNAQTLTSLCTLPFKLKVIKQYPKLLLVKDADAIETFSVHFVMLIDNFLTTSEWIKLSKLPLLINVLILCPLVIKYWIDFLNEYGAGPVIVAKNRKCFEAPVCWFGGCCGFDW